MQTSAGIARAPYILTVAARTCSCNLAPKELGRKQQLDKAVKAIEGYWNVYLAFFGEQVPWLDFLVVDVRDGRIVWRNGRPTTEGGKPGGFEQEQDDDRTVHGRAGAVGDAGNRR